MCALHNQVLKVAPIVNEPTPYAASYKLDWLSATGTDIFLAALVSMAVLGMKAREVVQTFVETFSPVLTIMFVLGFAYIATPARAPRWPLRSRRPGTSSRCSR